MAHQQEPEKMSAPIHQISEFKRGSRSKKHSRPDRTFRGITRLTVGGFKSISHEQSIEIRPLTILAGVNSSGKSSMMQPLLLLKQTLEAPYDPGVLLLDGPNVRFSSTDQILSHIQGQDKTKSFHVGIQIDNEISITPYYTRGKLTAFDIEQELYELEGATQRLYAGMSQEEMAALILPGLKKAFPQLASSEQDEQSDAASSISYSITRNRCFLTIDARFGSGLLVPVLTVHNQISRAEEIIRQIIHLSGLRGSPERVYPVTAVGLTFPGNFESYFASVINHWQAEGNKEKLMLLNKDLMRLGLTSNVVATSINW